MPKKRRKIIPFDKLKPFFGKPLIEASKQLGTCITLIKSSCRAHGIARWPYPEIQRMEKTKRYIENLLELDSIGVVSLREEERCKFLNRYRKLEETKCQLEHCPQSIKERHNELLTISRDEYDLNTVEKGLSLKIHTLEDDNQQSNLRARQLDGISKHLHLETLSSQSSNNNNTNYPSLFTNIISQSTEKPLLFTRCNMFHEKTNHSTPIPEEMDTAIPSISQPSVHENDASDDKFSKLQKEELTSNPSKTFLDLIFRLGPEGVSKINPAILVEMARICYGNNTETTTDKSRNDCRCTEEFRTINIRLRSLEAAINDLQRQNLQLLKTWKSEENF